MDNWTGMGPNEPAPKLDPNCQCICHSQPGVMHFAACCSAPPMTAARDDLAALVDVYWKLRSYAVHDDDCTFNRPPHYRGCSCRLTAELVKGEAAAARILAALEVTP